MPAALLGAPVVGEEHDFRRSGYGSQVDHVSDRIVWQATWVNSLSPQEAEKIGAFLDQVAAEATEAFDIGQRLRRPQPGDPDVPDALGWAFDYELLTDDDPRFDDEGPYGVQWAAGRRTYPPHVEEVPDEVLDLWNAVLARVSEPLVAGRLADLLWTRRHGKRPYDHALLAGRCLVEGTPSIEEPMQRVEALQRAASIGLSVSSQDLQSMAADALGEELEEANKEDQPLPGVVFGIIDGLEKLSSEGHSPVVTDSLDRLIETSTDPWTVAAALERLATRAGNPTEREGLLRRAVLVWLDRGSQADGITRLVFYEQAYAAAERHGFKDLRDLAQAAMQTRAVDESELRRIRSKAELPTEFATWIDGFSEIPDWTTALLRLLDFGPLAGDPGQIRESISEELRSSLSALFPTKLLGPEGQVIAEIPGGLEGLEERVRQRQAFQATYVGEVMTAGLAVAADSLGAPDPEAVARFFSSGLAAESAEVFARAVTHHLGGRFDEAVHIAYPRVERVLRNAARAMGLVVLRPPRGREPGGVKSLRSILTSLTGAMPEPWRVTFDTILTDPLGLNVRNLYAHGLGGTGSPLASALLIYVAVSLAKVFSQSPPNSEE